MQILGTLTVVGLFIGFIYGYIINIIWIVGQTAPLDIEQVISILGIFMAPLGVVMGYIH